MQTHAEKKQKKKNQSVSNPIAKVKGGEGHVALQEKANNSPKVKEASQLQEIANEHSIQEQTSNTEPVIQGYFEYDGKRLRDLNAEIVSIFRGSAGFMPTLLDYQTRRDDQETPTDIGTWYYQQLEARGWDDRSTDPRGDLNLSLSTFIGNYVGGIYAAPVGIHDYLQGWEEEHAEPQREEPLEFGQTMSGENFTIQMPREMVGDLGERLLKEWIVGLGIKPHSEQNNSGHGLDLLFRITLDQVRSLPPQGQQIFSQIIPSGPLKTRSGRVSRSSAPEPSGSTKYVVILEVKANSAQLSKAQRDSYKYIYKQSKTGFGMKINQAIQEGCAELFYEVKVNISQDEPNDVEFDFINRDEPSDQGLPRSKDPIVHHVDEPMSHLSSKDLGDAGERFVREKLRQYGYTSVGSLQKDGGQGVDVVAIGPDGIMAFFEVKTHLGSGKKPQLTKREKKQSGFVSEILFNILYRKKGYEDVPHDIYQKAWMLYSEALNHDQEAREDRNEPQIGLAGVNTDQVVLDYLKSQARYFIMNVDFPALGMAGNPMVEVSQWKPPKG